VTSFTGSRKEIIAGNPDRRHISTSYAERQNLTMRMSMRRFTRLTNGFSKKVENLAHAVSLHFMYYNFGRIHKTPESDSGNGGGGCRSCLELGGNCGVGQLIKKEKS
jgi:hypothetical protein